MCSAPAGVDDVQGAQLVVGLQELLHLQELVFLGVVIDHLSAGCPWKESLSISGIYPESWPARVNITKVNISPVQGVVGPDSGEHLLVNTESYLLLIHSIYLPPYGGSGQVG